MAKPVVNENCHHDIRLNLKNFIFISCGVIEVLRKVSQGEESTHVM